MLRYQVAQVDDTRIESKFLTDTLSIGKFTQKLSPVAVYFRRLRVRKWNNLK